MITTSQSYSSQPPAISAEPTPDTFRLDDGTIQADPYAFYPILRDQRPVLQTNVGEQSWWVLSRQEDITKALMDPQTFSSRTLPDPAILFLDNPEHDRLRAMVTPWFSRTAIHQLSGPIEARAEALIGDFARAGGGDIIQVATELTITMISGMLGVPPRAVERLNALRQFLPGFLAHRNATRLGREPSPEAIVAMEEFEAAHGAVIDDGHEPDGVVAAFVDHLDQGHMTRAECLSYVSILFGAGHSTTTDLIGNAAYVLTQRPGDLERMVRDEAFVTQFIEEVLRTRPSFHRIPRITTRDVEIGGEVIPAGSLVRLLLGSANRDPAMFEDAEEFDPDKKRRMHLAFGKGIHTCLGNWLARLEATIALRGLARHAVAIQLDPASPPRFHSGGTFNNFGFERLPVLLRARGSVRCDSTSGTPA